MRRSKTLLPISADAETNLINAARSKEPVKGLTHRFYKYPARFSPAFARAAIHAFTNPGDLVIDNHVGGGTTLVEALAAGRDAIGVDISQLAEFVASVKTNIYSDNDLEILDRWANRVAMSINIHRKSIYFSEYDQNGYYKHLNHPSRWRLRKAIEQSMCSAIRLRDPKLEDFARCAILRTAQWALDGRAIPTSVSDFREQLTQIANQMVLGAKDFRFAVNSIKTKRTPRVKILNRSSAGLQYDIRIRNIEPPKLIITSPPYPGVHVLYHRFQVDGRKETPLPFMIAGRYDGAGISFYTMGDRRSDCLEAYFSNIKASMSSVVALSDLNTVFVQMIAFSEPKWQLPRYLEVMEEAGLKEKFLPSLLQIGDGRLWRSVPGRRWYSDQRGKTPASKEVVLLHMRQ